MERLTDRRNNQNDRRLSCMNHCYNAGDCINCDSFENAVDRLAAYEDAEEAGLLLRLPCKVGDTVYVMHFTEGSEARIEAQTVTEISSGCDDWYISTMTHGVGGIYSFDSLGIVWWLNREEAEAALAKEE